MKVFNTLVVKDIVNLYNWKGPAAFRAQKKNKPVTVMVDEYSKSKVNECVHDFLLVLCTSHKYGIIFKDPLVGLGKKHHNALMYTVLESLERPWEHSYACELVTKICGACPDLAKTMWSNLKPFLEPRLTQKWLNAIKFAKTLLKELQPNCIEFSVKELSVYQLAQIVQFLVAPIPILKILLPENQTYELLSVKKAQLYLVSAKSWLSPDDQKKFKIHVTNHITRNFPDGKAILTDWDLSDETSTEIAVNITQSQFLENIFDIIDLYKKLVPQLLDSLNSSNITLTNFLNRIGEICSNEAEVRTLQIKIISIFVDIDQSKFTPNTKSFSVILSLLLKFYYDNRDSSIFDGCLYEINIWINGVLDLKSFDENVAQTLAATLKLTYKNLLEYIEELSKFKSEQSIDHDISEIIENLLNDVTTTENKIIIKHRYLSPMIVGFLRYLSDSDLSKSIKVYSNFVLLNVLHCQTNSEILNKVVQNYDALPKNIKDYFLKWTDGNEIAVVKKSKGELDLFYIFSEEFLTGNINNFLSNNDLSVYSDLPLNLLQASIFYISNLTSSGLVTKHIIENCENFIKHLLNNNLFIETYIIEILGHPILLNNTSFLSLKKRKTTKSLHKIFGKLLSTILRILKKPQKYNNLTNFTDILRLFSLSYEQCFKVLSVLSDIVMSLNDIFGIVLEVLIFSLENFANLCQENSNGKPLTEEMVQNLTSYFEKVCERQEINVDKLSGAFHKYFEVFPHNIGHINSKVLKTILNRNEYSKENISFSTFFLDRNIRCFDSVKNDLDTIISKRGVILPIIDKLVDKNYEEDILKEIFVKM
ncbi:hypothetical protein NQ317_006386 [Molorchus minor]|uniref:URB1 N-terminal domain-containing protein n=1 Tax=Molorchus minor TaxID=1323400 RepID=A0ABQ9ITB5_9CUCU|nr:hypothetical protein NQ317_006386 [Molorchus minor]